MGGLHTSNVYMACIGDHIAGSEIPQLWIEAEILTAGEADKIMQGRDYKAGLRIYRITCQAAWRIILPQFILYLREFHKYIFIDISASANTEESVQTLLTRINTHEFFNVLDKFLSIKKKDKNFAYLLTYMDMV